MKGRAMNILMVLIFLGAAAFLAFALWVRFAPNDPARWHGDPAAFPDPATPNFARRTVDSPLSPDALRTRLERAAQAEGAEVLAEEDGLVTWIARTRLMAYPDFVSIRLDRAEDGGTRLTALSRSRFGRSDMGVNAARLDRWLSGL